MSALPREKWLEARRQGIGGSEIAGLLGLSPWATPLSIYLTKTGELADQDSPAKRAGRRLEGVTADWFAEDAGVALTEPGLIVHPQYPFILGTPDRFIVGRDDTVLEIKTARFSEGWGESGTDDVPTHYRLQAEWYCYLTDRDVAIISTMFGGYSRRDYTIPRDRELGEMLVERARQFWGDCVVPRRPPPIDGSEEVKRWLTGKWKDLQPFYKRASPEMDATACALRDLEAKIAKQEITAETLRNELREFIAEDSGIEGSFGKILWKFDSQGKTSWKGAFDELLRAAQDGRPPTPSEVKMLILKNRGERSRPFRPYWK